MSLRLNEILRRGGKLRFRAGKGARNARLRPTLDSLEIRALLSNIPPTWKPTSSDLTDIKNGPMANAGQALISLYEDYLAYQTEATSDVASTAFTATNANLPMNMVLSADGTEVGVDVNGWGDFNSFVAQVEAAGMQVGATDPNAEIAEGYVPITSLPTIARLSQVVGLNPTETPLFRSVGSAPDQGEQTMFADVAKQTYGVDGTGVKVGILSNSVSRYAGGLADSVKSGDLPNNVQVIEDGPFGSDDEGRAMLEEVHDVAPGASLAFATAEDPNAADGQVGFANNIVKLQQAGANVIADDVYYFDEPVFQQGVISNAINQVNAAGVTYLSAAGNTGDQGYIAQFRGVNTSVLGVGSGIFQNFNSNSNTPAVAGLPVSFSGTTDLVLQWDNPFYTTTGVGTDLDVYVVNPTTNQVVASGTTDNIASQSPIEDITVPAGNYNVVVKVAQGQAPGYISLEVPPGGATFTQTLDTASTTYYSSTYGHPTATGAIGVGAMPWWVSTPWDSQFNPIPSEPYSSYGPQYSIFNYDGTRHTVQVVDSPQVSGPDGIDTSFFTPGDFLSTTASQFPTSKELDGDAFPNFFGTSAATPNVAGVVALMKQANPKATPADMLDALEESAVPLNGASAGIYSEEAGYGLVQAPAAIQSIEDQLAITMTPPSNVHENDVLSDIQIATFSDPAYPSTSSVFSATVDWGNGNSGLATIQTLGPDLFGVYSSNTYTLGGNYTITVTVAHTGFSIRSATSPIYVIPPPIDLTVPYTAASPLVMTVGQTLNGAIGSFVDEETSATTSANYSVSVTWSDLTSTAPSLVANKPFNSYTIDTSRYFGTVGTFTYTVSITSNNTAKATATGTVQINDAPLLPGTAVSIVTTEGLIYSGPVARFIHQAPDQLASDYSATITWGDGHVTPGLITNDPKVTDGFVVSGSNQYNLLGDYAYTVAIRDVTSGSTLTMPVATTPPNVIVVNDAALVASGTAFGLVEGQTFHGTVATFTDGNKTSVASDFLATINWGDGTSPTQGTIVPAGAGAFDVTGSHIYHEGNWKITVTVAHITPPATVAGITPPTEASASTTTSASISDAQVSLSTTGVSALTTVEGSTFSGVIAYLTDADVYATAADFIKTPTSNGNVTITWGDGTSVDTTSLDSSGNPLLTIVPTSTPGKFAISSSHEYDEFGKYAIGVTAVDFGGSTASVPTLITITDAPFTASGVGQLQALDGVAFTDPVATFIDSNPHPHVNDFTATIDWGDTTASTGVVTANADGSFSVAGNHVYSDSPTPYALVITIHDAGGMVQTVTTTSIYVPDAPITATAVPLSPTPLPGVQFNALVATFTTPNPIPNPSNYSATIDWGDGTVDKAQILPNGSVFDVRGSHIYAEGDYVIAVNIADVGGSKAQTYSSLSVADAPLTISAPTSIAAVEGTPVTVPVATFSSADPLLKAANFQANIDWGDGTVTTDATITPSTGGAFNVSGSHSYEQVTTFPINVSILSAGGSSTSTVTQAVVSDASIIGQVLSSYQPNIGVTASPNLFAFVDGDPNQPASSYTAKIDWGDGTGVTDGVIVPDPSTPGRFFVQGTHAYDQVGAFTIAAGIFDSGGGGLSLTENVTVSDPAILATFVPFTTTAGQIVTPTVAVFSDPNPFANANSFSATINWGDGTTDIGSVFSTGTAYAVGGAHFYAVAGTRTVIVTIQSSGGSTATVSGTSSVAVRITNISVTSLGAGPSGATSSNTPTFAGTAGPGDVLTVMGFRSGMTAPFVIGRTLVGADGSWSVTSSSLFDGTYTITVSTTDTLGNASSTPVLLPQIVVDTVPPRVTGLSLNPKTGTAVFSIQDDRSGLIDSELLNPAFYTLYLPTLTGNQHIAVTGVSLSPGGATDVRTVTLTFASNNHAKVRHKPVLKAGKYVLSINGNGITDNAGNALSESFFTVNSPSHPSASSTYIAQLITNGSAPASPTSVHVSTSPKPKAPKVKHTK